jgi:hypothetical protein
MTGSPSIARLPVIAKDEAIHIYKIPVKQKLNVSFLFIKQFYISKKTTIYKLFATTKDEIDKNIITFAAV